MELKTMSDWKSMVLFAVKLIEQGKGHKGTDVWGERIAILHLDHANELLMKAFLIKEGYVVSYADKNDLKKGIKESELLDYDKTISYLDALNLVCREVGFAQDKKEKIAEFHKLRNEIQHRATNIQLNKLEKINNFLPFFEELSRLMFPKDITDFPKIFA